MIRGVLALLLFLVWSSINLKASGEDIFLVGTEVFGRVDITSKEVGFVISAEHSRVRDNSRHAYQMRRANAARKIKPIQSPIGGKHLASFGWYHAVNRILISRNPFCTLVVYKDGLEPNIHFCDNSGRVPDVFNIDKHKEFAFFSRLLKKSSF